MTTILAIETDKSLIEYYQRWLQDYNLLIANSHKDGMSLLTRYPNIQILLTQQFAEEADTSIHQLIKSTDVYVIATTSARPSHTIRSQLITQGADAVLFKPFSFEQLNVLLQHFLHSSPAHPSTSHYN